VSTQDSAQSSPVTESTSTEPETAEEPDAAQGTAEEQEAAEEPAPEPEAAVVEAATDEAATDEAAADDGAEGGERWSAFAPPEAARAGRTGTITRGVAERVGRVLAHEWTLAALGSVLLAAIMTWPTLKQPMTTIPQDTADPTLQAWQMAWAGHALTTSPGSLWDGNAFYPDRYSYAFSDTLLGYAPFGMIGNGPVATLLRYNIVFVLAFALAFFGCYVLIRQIGAGKVAAAVGGAAFAYAPWRLSQGGHLHVLSIGGIALALAMLARGHGFSLRDGYRPELSRWGWVLAGWLVAAWQIMLGFGIGLPFAYFLLGLLIVCAVVYVVKRLWFWKVRRPFTLKLLLANVAGGLVFAAVSVLMAYPYLQVLKLHPNAARSEDYLALFSPPLKGFFIAPPESWLWSHKLGDLYANARASLPWAPEMTLLPGFFLYGLALAGLFVSIWSVRQRVLLGAGVLVTIVLAMGTNGPDHGRLGYLFLYRHFPGFEGIRTSGRFVLWTTLFLAILAAGAVGAFTKRGTELEADRQGGSVYVREPTLALRLATLIPLALVLVEGANATPHPVVPRSPVAMDTVQGPAVILPTEELFDMNVMLWSTDGFPKMINGGSGFQPKTQEDLRTLLETFPDQASVDRLRELHIKSVVVIRSRIVGTPYERAADAPIDGLNLTRTENGDIVTYKVN
jgi:hypothetical protein